MFRTALTSGHLRKQGSPLVGQGLWLVDIFLTEKGEAAIPSEDQDRQFCEMAVELAKKSVPEDNEPPPVCRRGDPVPRYPVSDRLTAKLKADAEIRRHNLIPPIDWPRWTSPHGLQKLWGFGGSATTQGGGGSEQMKAPIVSRATTPVKGERGTSIGAVFYSAQL